MAALTSFCSKYSHPFCRVLVAAVLQEPGEGVVGSWEAWLPLGAGEGPSCRVLSPGRHLSRGTCVRNHGGMGLFFSGQVNTWGLGWEMGLQMPEMDWEGWLGWLLA